MEAKIGVGFTDDGWWAYENDRAPLEKVGLRPSLVRGLVGLPVFFGETVAEDGVRSIQHPKTTRITNWMDEIKLLTSNLTVIDK